MELRSLLFACGHLGVNSRALKLRDSPQLLQSTVTLKDYKEVFQRKENQASPKLTRAGRGGGGSPLHGLDERSSARTGQQRHVNDRKMLIP